MPVVEITPKLVESYFKETQKNFDASMKAAFTRIVRKGETILASDAERYSVTGTGVGWNHIQGLKPPTIPAGMTYNTTEDYRDTQGSKHSKLPQG